MEVSDAKRRNSQNAAQNGDNVAPENVALENLLALTERPDRKAGLHPFTAAVMRAMMPENKVLPAMEKYGGTSDPVKHLRSFVDVMAVYSSDDMV